MFDDIKLIPQVKEWGWQTEICPDTGRQHYQGYILATSQVRLSHWVKHLKGVHVEIARNWNALLSYCKKTETAVEGTQVVVTNEQQYWTMERSFCELASYWSKFSEQYEHERRKSDTTETATRRMASKGYWYCVKQVVAKEPFRLSIFAQPQMEKTFVNTYELYLDPMFRALVLQPENPGPLRVKFSDEDSPGE